jgi:DNA-binding NtrC family response regulator
MRRGAYDVIEKPLDLNKLEVRLLRALRSRAVETENKQLKRALDVKYGLEKLIGHSPAMIEICDRIQQVAASRASVLIEGESGTGKELVAHSLHQLSNRKERPFVVVHCAALSAQLLESELFGHEKGAFTGAMERRIGRFEEANHGTIFLDEIGEIDQATQVKLLRVLGERTLQRVGSNQLLSVDVRVITATNRDLEKMVAEGKFRDDLFFRLNVIRIKMPPLRERKDDLPLLIQAFLKEFATENDKKVTEFTTEAMDVLLRYQWPGNVRELRSVIENGVVLARSDKVGIRDLPERVFGSSIPSGSSGTTAGATGLSSLNLTEMEQHLMRQALLACRGNRTEAAGKLGISRRTLHRKLREYQMENL